MFLNSTKDSLIRIEKPDREIEVEEPFSKVESVQVILVPNGTVLLSGGSRLNNPLYYFLRRK
jgi:hypothetical protein